MKRLKQRFLICLLAIIFVMIDLSGIPQLGIKSNSETVYAAGLGLNELMAKFPHGKYWNHFVNGYDSYADTLFVRNDNTYGYSVTDTPCQNHGIAAPANGTTDCNVFFGGMQCCGFARVLAYSAYGSDCRTWGNVNISSIKPGDVLHYYGANADVTYGHWVMVIGVSGSILTVGECNIYNNPCMISWGNKVDYNKFTKYTCYSAPYALPQSTTPTEILPTSVSLNRTTVTLTAAGATTTLTATVSPSNATNKAVTWTSSNSSVATVNSNGVVTAVANGTTTITATTVAGAKTAACTVTVLIPDPTPTLGSDGWYYTSALPSNITADKYEIQIQNIYEKYATSSPGSDWTNTGETETTYTKSGNEEIKDLPQTTSDTYRLERYYYYHWCGPSKSATDVNYYQDDVRGYIHEDELHDVSSLVEYSTGTDMDDSRYTYYHLKWSSGYDAYCWRDATTGTCDKIYGEHGYRSYYWYKMYVYQRYTATTTTKYQKVSAWTTTKDSSATTVKYRYKLKPVIVTPDKVTLNNTNITLTSQNATATLTATVSPSNATDKSVTWKSSNTAVATVNQNGVVTAKGNGVAKITVTTATGGKEATCNVTVSIKCTGITLDKTSLTIAGSGQSSQLNATVLPSNAADKTVIWESNNPAVATVSNGKVTAKAPGTAIIKASCGGFSATCTVTVTQPMISISLNKTSLEMNVNTKETLSVSYNPVNTTDSKAVTWKSSDDNVATVSNGVVTAHKAGTVTITATCEGKKSSCTITVKQPLTGISISSSNVELDVNDSENLSVIFNETDTTDSKDVTWKSSNESIVSVVNGKLTAKKPGTVTITAICGNYESTCTVSVKQPLKGISFDTFEITLEKGDKTTISVIFNPSDTTDSKDIIWSTGNESVAIVNNGKITAIGAGETTITAMCNNFVAECKVIVEEKETVTSEIPTKKPTQDNEESKADDSTEESEHPSESTPIKPENPSENTSVNPEKPNENTPVNPENPNEESGESEEQKDEVTSDTELPTDSSEKESDDNIFVKVIIGIAIACLVGVAAMIIVIIIVLKRKK